MDPPIVIRFFLPNNKKQTTYYDRMEYLVKMEIEDFIYNVENNVNKTFPTIKEDPNE